MVVDLEIAVTNDESYVGKDLVQFASFPSQ